MTYKETLFFIGKCLTISHENRNKILVEDHLKSENVDWDAVVKLSTAHYVFPALYCNLKRANFLHYLPKELVNYMIHITDLNRERNQQIIDQAKEINTLLLDNNITPIFLKGTGSLLEGLYEDIAERMVGDIDFIVNKNHSLKSFNILKENSYSAHIDQLNDHRHLSRLIHKDKIGALEIHKELLIENFADEFNYDYIKTDSQIINEVNVMSYQNQLCLSIIAKQINDSGMHFKNIALRNAYDVFLLSKKTEAKKAFNQFNKLKNPLNNFLALCFEVFNKVDSLQYQENKETKKYVSIFKRHLVDESLGKKKYKNTSRKLFIKSRFNIIYKSIFNKSYRNWLIKRTSDKNWQKEKLIQLGFKKPKPNS
ncbi:nucleotidyltransferase family protein [uncultured Polaribacter sp.]|uniref:nucleotidyltransferase family protein n=1 Tax=uncultured Polaribacter sp. TaxID=174711 RepID=UPI002619838B|nr:nucleotidyltransferase family protein [uncultured Polaribacter sp.]